MLQYIFYITKGISIAHPNLPDELLRDGVTRKRGVPNSPPNPWVPPSHEPSHLLASSTAPSCPERRSPWPPRRESAAGSRTELPQAAG